MLDRQLAGDLGHRTSAEAAGGRIRGNAGENSAVRANTLRTVTRSAMLARFT